MYWLLIIGFLSVIHYLSKITDRLDNIIKILQPEQDDFNL